MDRPARNFLSLLTLALIFAAYSLCGFVALVALPLIDGDASGHSFFIALLPALALGGILVSAAWRGGRSVRNHLTASRELSERIQASTVPLPPRLRSATESIGLHGQVDLVDDEGVFSFTYQMLTPRIAISRGFLERLDDQELRATLEHERYHVRNLDPLRSLIAAAITDGLFLIPSFSTLRARYEASRELAADACSERTCGRRALLAALLSALDEDPGPAQTVSPSLATPALLDARIRRLETGRNPRLPGLDPRTLFHSAYGIATFTFLLALTLLGIGGPEMLRQAITSELNTSTNTVALTCIAPLFIIPMLAFGQLRRRAHQLATRA